jgi:RHS repeat-associated protein
MSASSHRSELPCSSDWRNRSTGSYVYDPYGKVTFLNANWGAISASAYASIYLFQGARFDTSSSLYYFRTRDLSATLGRWSTLDPTKFAAHDTNLYRYEKNAPERYTDPLGTQTELPEPGTVTPRPGLPADTPYRPILQGLLQLVDLIWNADFYANVAANFFTRNFCRWRATGITDISATVTYTGPWWKPCPRWWMVQAGAIWNVAVRPQGVLLLFAPHFAVLGFVGPLFPRIYSVQRCQRRGESCGKWKCSESTTTSNFAIPATTTNARMSCSYTLSGNITFTTKDCTGSCCKKE